jgi:hypothetical protein
VPSPIRRRRPRLALAGGDVASLVELATATGGLLFRRYDLDGNLASRAASSLDRLQAPVVTVEVDLDRARPDRRTAVRWSAIVPHAVLQLAWDPTTRDLEVSLPATAAVVHLPPLEPLELQLSAEGSLDPAARFVRLDRFELEAPGVGRAQASGSGGGATPFSAQLHVDVPAVERVRATLRPLIDAVPDDSLSGAAAAGSPSR